MQTLSNKHGASLLVAIILILVLGIVIASIVSMLSTQSLNAMNRTSAKQAYYIAMGGIQKALYQLKTGTDCNALSYADPLGAGSYTTIGTRYSPNPWTTLSAGINGTVTTIPVVDNTNYAPHGRIKIGSELIDYTAKSGTGQLIGARRGIAGSTASAHPINSPVLQSECLIQSTATVANPLPGVNSAQRVIETSMAYNTFQGSFQKVNRPGGPIQTITGVGFRPTAVIFFWTEQNGAGFNRHVDAGVGFASASGMRSVAVRARDRQQSSDDRRMRSDTYAILFLDNGQGAGPGVLARAQVTSFDPDGFTLNWTDNDNGRYLIHYIALGGAVTDAFTGTFTLNQNPPFPTNQSVNGVGFQPDFVMFLWSFRGAADSNVTDAEIGVGLASGPAARGALVFAARDNDNANNRKWWQQRTDSVILFLDPVANIPTQYAIADLVSMDVDGFTVNRSVPPSGNPPPPIFFLALKGGRHQVGAFNQPAGTGSQSTTGIGFQPEQLFMASFNRAAMQGITPNGSIGAISYGAAQYPNVMGNIWFQDRADADPSDANMYTNTANVITLAHGNAIRAQADFSSFDDDGFTLNWTAADATARQILYWAIGPAVTDGAIDWQEIY